MPPVTAEPPPAASIGQPPARRARFGRAGDPSDLGLAVLPITVDVFLKLQQDGLVDPDLKVELLDGRMVSRRLGDPEQNDVANPAHEWASQVLEDKLRDAVEHGTVVRVEKSLVLPSDGVPLPDVALVHGPRERYRVSLPTVTDVLCVVEVADATVRADREVKLPLYARDGVPMYVIVAIPERVVQVHTEPAGEAYQSLVTLRTGGTLALPMADGTSVEVPVDDLLPPAQSGA